MKPIRILIALTAALGLSACASVDTVSRNLPTSTTAPVAAEALPLELLQTAPRATAQDLPYAVSRVQVRVPASLTVSEANTYKPRADIVWREDALGDRYAQVQAIVQAAADQALADMTEGRPVIVDIQMTRFHALTEKARYTVGGTHDIHFYIAVYDAATGAMLEAPRLVETELKAYGGSRALEAMSRGETQKVRITRHLVEVIGQEMLKRSAPAPVGPLQLSAVSSRGI